VGFEMIRHVSDSTGTFALAAATRAALMGDVINYFFPPPLTAVEGFELYN
jgi:hypothetical protein